MTLSVRLETQLERQLFDYSTEMGLSKSDVVKQCLEAFFATRLAKAAEGTPSVTTDAGRLEGEVQSQGPAKLRKAPKSRASLPSPTARARRRKTVA